MEAYTIDACYVRLFDAIVTDAIEEHLYLTVGARFVKEVLVPIAGTTRYLENFLKVCRMKARVLEQSFLEPKIERIRADERKLFDDLTDEFMDFEGIEDETPASLGNVGRYLTTTKSVPDGKRYRQTLYYYGTPVTRVTKSTDYYENKESDFIIRNQAVLRFVRQACRMCELRKSAYRGNVMQSW